MKHYYPREQKKQAVPGSRARKISITTRGSQKSDFVGSRIKYKRQPTFVDCLISWATRIRTLRCWSQSPVPYHLAIAHHSQECIIIESAKKCKYFFEKNYKKIINITSNKFFNTLTNVLSDMLHCMLVDTLTNDLNNMSHSMLVNSLRNNSKRAA